MATKFPVIVVCHTILNDAFREYSDASEEKKAQQESAKFLIRYLIETQSSTNTNLPVLTSEQVMSSLDYNFPHQIGGNYRAQILIALRNLIISVDIPVNDLNESVIVISDVLSSRFDNVILVSNMKKKIDKILNFYQKSEKTSRRWKSTDIPFEIKDTIEIEKIFREIDKGICDEIDKTS